MHDTAVAGAPFQHPGEAILLEGHLRIKGVVRYLRRFGGHVVFKRHLDDRIRLATGCPARDRRWRRRHVRIITLWSAGIDPCRNRRDLLGRQAAVVPELPETRIRRPGRHLTRGYLAPDCFRPGAHLVVSQQRHRRDFARAMTGHTFGVDDRRDILCERRCRRRSPSLRSGRCCCDDRQPQIQHPHRMFHANPSSDTCRTRAIRS